MNNKYTLALNNAWLPVDIFDVRDTFRLLAKGHAKAMSRDYVLHTFDDWLEYQDVIESMSNEYKQDMTIDTTIRTVRMEIPVPEIIVLTHYGKIPKRSVAFSKENLWIRDKGECIFCGVSLTIEGATIDHIIPKSKGGETSFTNCAIACRECNHTKDDILLEHLPTHTLRFKPKVPNSTNPLYKFAGKIPIKESWKKFLIHG